MPLQLGEWNIHANGTVPSIQALNSRRYTFGWFAEMSVIVQSSV